MDKEDKTTTLIQGTGVATALGYSNPRKALAAHVDEEDKNTVVNPDGNRGNPHMVIINESDLFKASEISGSYPRFPSRER